jgi:hypothetical protein
MLCLRERRFAFGQRRTVSEARRFPERETTIGNKQTRRANGKRCFAGNPRPLAGRKRHAAEKKARAVRRKGGFHERHCSVHETTKALSASQSPFLKTTVGVPARARPIPRTERRLTTQQPTKTENSHEPHDQVRPPPDNRPRPAEERARAHLLRPYPEPHPQRPTLRRPARKGAANGAAQESRAAPTERRWSPAKPPYSRSARVAGASATVRERERSRCFASPPR